MTRRGGHRSSHEEGGHFKNRDNNERHSQSDHRKRNERTTNGGSMDRYRGRNRDLTPPGDRHKDGRRRRRRRRSDDNRRHDRRRDRRRRPRSRDRRYRRRGYSRSLSIESFTSISPQEETYYRRPNNRKRSRHYRESRPSRSRSRSLEHDNYRKSHYYSRDGDYGSRQDYYDYHHHRNPSYNRAARHSPRTGVVSDDDEGSRWHPPSQLASADNQASIPNGTKSNTKTNSHKKQHKGSPPSSKKTHDDTIGHFQGRDGCVLADRYRILKEVGVGTFGRVVECLDIKRRRQRYNRDDEYHSRRENDQQQRYHSKRERENRDCHDNPNNIVAIKIVRNVKRYYDSAKIEADIIRDVNRNGQRGTTHCAIMYDTFSFDGHYCMVFESLGPSLYDFLKSQKYHPFPIHCVRDFAKQLLETLDFLHGFRLIHTDLKVRSRFVVLMILICFAHMNILTSFIAVRKNRKQPENILLMNGRQVPQRGGYCIPESTRIKVIDFGGATYDNEKKSSIVNTRQYRAPEVILGVGWSMPSDLWSIGCILAELYQGELLFATHDNIEHLALIERVIGLFPRKMLKRARNIDLVEEAFDSSGSHRMEKVLPADKLSYVKRTAPLDSIITYDEDAWFLRLLRRILIIDPDERATAQECLKNF